MRHSAAPGEKGLALDASTIYNTKVNDKIVPLGANVILQGCYPRGGQAAAKYCEFVKRDPTTQRINRHHQLEYEAPDSDHLDGTGFRRRRTTSTRPLGRFGFYAQRNLRCSYDRDAARRRPSFTAPARMGSSASGVGGALPAPARAPPAINWGLNGFSAGGAYILHRWLTKSAGMPHGLMAGGGAMLRPESRGRAACYPWNSWDLTLGLHVQDQAGPTLHVGVGATNIFDQKPPKVFQRILRRRRTRIPTISSCAQVYARIGQSFLTSEVIRKRVLVCSPRSESAQGDFRMTPAG